MDTTHVETARNEQDPAVSGKAALYEILTGVAALFALGSAALVACVAWLLVQIEVFREPTGLLLGLVIFGVCLALPLAMLGSSVAAVRLARKQSPHAAGPLAAVVLLAGLFVLFALNAIGGFRVASADHRPSASVAAESA